MVYAHNEVGAAVRWRTQFWALLTALALLAAACGGDGGDAETAEPGEATDEEQAEAEPEAGGSVTVLLGGGFAGAWPSGLDPATNTTGGANISMQNAIFGGLFMIDQEPGSDEAEVVGQQAESWEISEDGLTVSITLRDGIEFSDGTPLDADAVVQHIERAVAEPCTCAPPWVPFLAEQEPIRVVDDLTFEVEFTQPNASVITAWPVSNVNWIPSPTALEEMGAEDFALEPVGAGPFTVVSNQLSTELVLEKNENYYKADEGLPYLDELTFQSIADDQAAYNAIQAGQADAFEGMNTIDLIEQADENPQIQATTMPATSPYIVQLNTQKPPFDDQLVREAFYYAIDTEAISEGLFDGRYDISQGPTGPGGLFHHAEVEGYRTYDPDRAREIIEEIGGLELTLGTISNPVANQVNTALQTMFEEAGMTVTTDNWDLAQLIEQFQGGDWDAMLQTVGAWDPAAGVSVAFRFHSQFDFTGVWDEDLDAMIDEGSATVDPEERDQIYQDIAKYISDNAYAPILFAFAPTNLAVEGVHGPGLTTPIPPLLVNAGIHWDRAWREQG
jgi:peptide/nickel transport system substrate-binding protein